MHDRRQFVQSIGTSALATRFALAENSQTGTPPPGLRKRIAVVVTQWSYLSHAQHLTDRFLLGYPHEGRWHRPAMDVVSLYVDQKPPSDQSASRAEQFNFRVYPTIAEALRCGGPKLDVDAVFIIAEHGDYPKNEKGQILYPRYEFFEQVVDVFQSDGRVVPVYNDMHLSYSMAKARKMVAASKRLKFPLLAGSSLPVTWRLPELELPPECELEDALMVGVGSSDSSAYHALEALQCMVERRRGGETGIKSVQLIEGDAVWQAGNNGLWSLKLLEAALSRSDLILGQTLVDSRPQDLVGNGELPRIVTNPEAWLINRTDGLRTTLLVLNGAVGDYTFAARLKGQLDIVSTQFYLPPKPNLAYSACLASRIEAMIETGTAPYPVERTLVVSGMLESGLDSRIDGHRILNTSHLNVRYRAPRESQYCRT